MSGLGDFKGEGRASWIGVGVAIAAALGACGKSGTVVEVFAASSLREPFVALEQSFEAKWPGVDLVFNFAGSQELRAQLEHGAGADVIAVADVVQLETLRQTRAVESEVTIAENTPVIVLSQRAPKITELRDLAQLERIVIGAPEVPIGKYAAQILIRLGATFGKGFVDALEARIVSRELNARQVLAKVQLGEADAGIVYRTDAMFAGLGYLEIPGALNVTARYPMAILSDSDQPVLAAAWVEFVRSEAGSAALEAYGFRVPESER